MVTISKVIKVVDGKQLVEIACLSTDTMPTTGIYNGSLCLVMDTGEIWAFNGQNRTWLNVA